MSSPNVGAALAAFNTVAPVVDEDGCGMLLKSVVGLEPLGLVLLVLGVTASPIGEP